MKVSFLWLSLGLLLTQRGLASDRIDQFLEWNAANLKAVELSSPSPCLVARNFAIIQGAAFEAYNAQSGKYESEFDHIPEVPEEGIDAEIACLAALGHASETLFPSYSAYYRRLWAAQRADWPESELTERSLRYGMAVADTCLLDRADDGASGTITYIPKDEVGKWRRTPSRYRPPELPQWPRLKTFVLGSGDQFRPPPPPALDSVEYADAVNEVRELGRKRMKPGEDERETTIARFWSCFNYTATPSGHWNEIASILVRQEGSDFEEVARVYAVLNLILSDVGVACWDCKYHYEFWRPIQAIRGADRDGNDATVKDSDWVSELEAPPHPEYPSGHSAFSGAGARILSILLGRDDVTFEVGSISVPGVKFTYSSLEKCADEIGMSRLYGGIHYRFSNQTGLTMGRDIAEWATPLVYPKRHD